MKTTTKLALALLIAAGLTAPALGQSSPNLRTGQVPTAAQWNGYFAAKQDLIPYVTVNKAGDIMLGPLGTAAPTTSKSGFNLPNGVAPTTPTNGDLWTTTAGLFVRINGVTIGPLTGSTTTSFSATSPLVVTFPSGVTNYALNYDSNFNLCGSNLCLNAIPAGNLIANSTSGSAEPTFTTLSAVIDQAISSVQGSILYRSGTGWAVLAPGTAGAPLLTGGASANPAYGVLSVPFGGTGLSSGTSGGIPYFNTTTSLASSALLATNGFVVGGGAGLAPNTVVLTGLVKGNGSSAPTAYAGTSCTNQFPRSLDLNGVATCSSVLTADITAANVTYAKIQNVAGLSIFGRSTSSAGVGADITGTANQFLGINSGGTTLGFQTMGGDATLSGGTLTLGANVVTYAKFQQVAASSLVGNPTGSLANAQGITLGATLAFSGTALQTAAHTGDVTTSANSFATTLANIPTGVPMAGSLLATNIVAPSTPASGKTSIYVDSTDKRLHDKNDAGAIGTTVVADTGASNNFLTAISAAGVISKAQPSAANLSNGVSGSGAVCLVTNCVLTTPTLGVASGTSLALGGATIGTDALAWTGTATGSGQLNAASFVPTGSTVPTNGMYLSAANTVTIATNTTARLSVGTTNVQSTLPIIGTNAAAFQLANNAASSTVPTLIPNRADTTTGIGAQASGNISLIAGGVEQARITSTGINNAAIGQTTPGAGAFTTLTATTPVALTSGGTGAATAVAARQSASLNVWGDAGTGHGDANVTIGNAERTAYTNAAFTAARTWTLPAANVTGAPYAISILDMAGGVTPTNTLSIQRAGSDTVNGGTAVTITAANGGYTCTADGTSKWSCQSTGAASGGGVSSITAGAGLTGGTITTSGTIAINPGQIPGTTTNDNATAGNVGEYVSSSVATNTVSLTSGSTSNITSISLTAGDWDVVGQAAVVGTATTSFTRHFGGVSRTTGTAPNSVDDTQGAFDSTFSAIVPGTSFPMVYAVPRSRMSLASTTTVFLVVNSTFTVSTATAGGFISARRVR